MGETSYDLVVLGAGATGLGAAFSAARAKRRVALFDGHKPGGDCTHYGCVPSKTLIEVARRVHGARQGGEYGFRATVEVDMAAVAARVKAVIGEIEQDESPQLLASRGVDFVPTEARFVDPHTLETADGDRVHATAVVIATGASAAVPPVPGLDTVPFLTNETVFDLTELPDHLVTLGGGPIACELAQAFRRLGSKVTIVQSPPRLIPKDDPEACEVVRQVFEREGVTVVTGATAVRVSDGPTLHLDDGREVRGSHLLVAVGRRPRTEGFGLEAVGVQVDPRSHRVVVDEHLRTAQRHIWAAGDCASPYQFTHTGDDQGRLAAGNAFARRAKKFDTRVIPWTTFTEPEVGHVGLTEAEAYEAYGEKALVAMVPMDSQDRARCAGETDGFVKLIAAPATRTSKVSKYLNRVVGMTAVCPVGGELVHEAAVAMQSNMLAARLALTIHAYPTWSIATRLAAAQFFGEYFGRTARPARADGGAGLLQQA